MACGRKRNEWGADGCKSLDLESAMVRSRRFADTPQIPVPGHPRLWGWALLCALACLAGCKQDRDANAEAPLSEEPAMVLRRFHAEVTRGGIPREKIDARFARMNEKQKILDLQGLHLQLFNEGKEVGQATCGTGRLWLKERPEEKIARNDVAMGGTVDYRTHDGWILRTPALNFSNADSTLRSDRGYIKQRPMGEGYIVGRGDRFEIKLNLEKSTFEHWNEHGAPAVIEKKTEPELLP
jgi:hypothetical protein